MVKPYLPDIINNCVTRVDAAFSTRATDPFNVFFDKGILQQVKRSVYAADGNFPLVWFVMKYDENFGTNFSIFSEANFQMVIAMPTDNNYTQQQREDISFKPRLLPLYDQLIKEFNREKWFITVGDNSIKHTRSLLPYWGMGDVEGADSPNLFKGKFIDAVAINVNGLKIRRQNCSNQTYTTLDTTMYPISSNKLTFYDDIELVVGGGESYDPAPDSSSVIVPQLIGKDFEVVQRGFGQLRQKRSVEIIPDTVNGGFALTGGQKFNLNDTYFIKIRPAFVP